jgi:hypothetical protein
MLAELWVIMCREQITNDFFYRAFVFEPPCGSYGQTNACVIYRL